MKVYLKVVKFREHFEKAWQDLLIDFMCNRKETEGSEMPPRFFLVGATQGIIAT